MVWVGTVRHWDYPTSRSVFICKETCGGRRGFTNDGTAESPWWVCHRCHRPTEGWFRAQGDEVLNKFIGGPLDGMVYTSTSLLSDPYFANAVLTYTNTQEVVSSKDGGSIARVWQFSASVVTTESTSNGVRTMTNAQETTESQAAPAVEAEAVDTSDLLKTRTDLKLSRTPVAAAAGVTVAQLARIEKGGNRTTAAEAEAVRGALRNLAAAQPQAEAAPAEAASDPS